MKTTLLYTKHKCSGIIEQMKISIAWMLPSWLVYWAAIRLMAYATTGKYSDQEVPALLAMDALKRYEEKL